MKPVLNVLRRFYPLAAFLGGFIWDALTIGRHVGAGDLWRLGASLLAAGGLIVWLCYRDSRRSTAPAGAPACERKKLRTALADFAWQAPYLLLQFFFGSIFSALFILYFKSSGHLGTWLTAALLGALLVGNEFAGKRFGRHYTLVWGIFALNAILLCNFALPHAIGSIDPRLFYVSTLAGVTVAHLLWRFSPGRPGHVLPAWLLAAALLFAWRLDMIAPVPLVKEGLAVGHAFNQRDGRYALSVEGAPAWQFWLDQAATAHVGEGEKLYGVSAVSAPLGMSAALEHRWELREAGGWRETYRRRFETTGGRERGFRAYSWVLNPQPGEWRFTVATQDGRTIATSRLTVERGAPAANALLAREF